MKFILVYSIIFVVSYVGVYLLRRWVRHKNILDVPNERSSHSTPTPRGGGLIIVAVSLLFYILAGAFFNFRISWAYLAGAGCIALISWLDDLFTIAVGWRLLVHSLAAVLVIGGSGYWQEAYVLFGHSVRFGLFGAVITFCWIIWLTNAFNFMDGIDGLAGVQTITAGIGWMVAGSIGGFPETGIFAGALVFSGLGFLLHNWQPAKIFMGDVGSAFLGFTFAVLPLLAANEDNSRRDLLPLAAVILVWLFFFDSVLTFFKRAFRRERVWQPHREHIYQELVILGYSHRLVSSLYGLTSTVLVAVLLLRLGFGAEYDILLLLAVVAFSVGLFGFTLIAKRRESGNERGLL